MSITHLITQYGYIAVALGCFLEGETVLLTAGFAARRGILDLPTVILVAFLASTAGDQFYFQLGRHYGRRILDRFKGLQRAAPRVEALLDRFHAPLILGIRFMVGLRIAGPIVIGWSRVGPWRFAVLNMIGAAVWAALIAWLGYALGSVLEKVVGDVQQVEHWIMLGLVLGLPAAGLAIGLVRRHWPKH